METVDLSTLARLARLALGSDDPYLFTRVVPVLARAVPDDPEWQIGYLACLAKLGLGALGRHFTHRLSSAAHNHEAVSSLIQHLDQVRDNAVAWTSRRRRFQANLEALSSRDPQSAEQIGSAWTRGHAAFELHQDVHANYQVMRAGQEWPPAFCPALDGHRKLEIAAIETQQRGLLPLPYVFDGVGLGWGLVEACRKSEKVFLDASAMMYVVEPEPLALAIVLHLHDMRVVLADSRFRIFTGGDALDRYRACLGQDCRMPLTERHYRLPLLPQSHEASTRATMVDVGRTRQEEAAQLRDTIAARYADRDAVFWASRFARAADESGRATDKPLRILAVTSLHTTFLQYSMRDCLQALESLGHTTKLLVEPTTCQPLDLNTALRQPAEFEPDLVFLLSRMRYEMTDMIHPSVPSVTWDQDALPWVFDPSHRDRFAWNDFVMGFAAASAVRRFGWPAHRCLPCQMASSPDTYSSDALSEEELVPYRCDVSYVSHASTPVQEEMRSVESWLPSDGTLRQIFRDASVELISYWKGGGDFPGPISPTVLAVMERTGVTGLAWDAMSKLIAALSRLGDRVFRHMALKWVADWADRTGRDLRLYGRGWEHHPRFAKYARGPASNGHELRCIYQASRINLQLMAFGFLHQRALDGLMAGAFFMTRRSKADTSGPAVRKLVRLLETYEVESVEQLRALSDGHIQQEILALFETLGHDPRIFSERVLEGWRNDAAMCYAPDVLPQFDDISFGHAAEFEEASERFLGDDGLRDRVAGGIRDTLVNGFSYERRMRDMITFVRDGFVEPGTSVERPRDPRRSSLSYV